MCGVSFLSCIQDAFSQLIMVNVNLIRILVLPLSPLPGRNLFPEVACTQALTLLIPLPQWFALAFLNGVVWAIQVPVLLTYKWERKVKEVLRTGEGGMEGGELWY